jgi:hypothetical protein
MYNDFFFNQIKKFEAWAEHYPIWIGEFGAASPYEKSWNTQKTVCIELVNYALSKDIGFNLWISRETHEIREEKWSLVEDILESSAFPEYNLSQELGQLQQDYDELENDLSQELGQLQQDYDELQASYDQQITDNNSLFYASVALALVSVCISLVLFTRLQKIKPTKSTSSKT